jgi:phosphatidylinositol glycan class K
MLYELCREYGIPDENIIFMSPDNIACNSRNNEPGVISIYDGSNENIYEQIEVDYKGIDVSVDNFLNVIRQRHAPETPLNRRLRSDSESRVFIYINGHGGNGYHKLQDTHVISDHEFAKAVEELYAKRGFKEMLIISDSCGAFTIFDYLEVPNIFMIGSSSKDEKSYSLGKDSHVGLSKTDDFSFKTYEFGRDYKEATLEQYMSIMDPVVLGGHPQTKNTHAKLKAKDFLLSDYISSHRIRNSRFFNCTLDSDQDAQEEIKYAESIMDFINSIPQQQSTKSNNNNQEKSTIDSCIHYSFETPAVNDLFHKFVL